MKYFLTIIFLLGCNLANAEYVLYEVETNKIVDISRRNDAVIQEGQAKVEVGKVIEINYPIEFYKMNGNKVEFDAKAYNEWQIEQAKKKAEAEEKEQEEALIEAKIKELAITQLEAEGTEFKHFGKKGGK